MVYPTSLGQFIYPNKNGIVIPHHLTARTKDQRTRGKAVTPVTISQLGPRCHPLSLYAPDGHHACGATMRVVTAAYNESKTMFASSIAMHRRSIHRNLIPPDLSADTSPSRPFRLED